MRAPKFALGDEAKEIVTGFQGIVIARTEWLNGCVRYIIQPQALKKDGSLPKAENFDEESLVLIEKDKVVVQPSPTGGPKDDATASRVTR